MARQYPEAILKRLQATELEILQAVAELCRAHNIPWFLSCGSLLGVVRHGGFIPWDDDMDIGMLRPDYDRFLKVARTELPEAYRLCIPGEEPGMAAIFTKVCKRGTKFYTQEVIDAGFDQGIFIDIFCYERICRDDAKRAKQVKLTQRYKKMLYLYHSGNVNIEGKQGAALRFYQTASKAAHGLLHATSSDVRIRRAYERAARMAADEPDSAWASFHRSTGVQIETDIFMPTRPAQMDGVEVLLPNNAEQYLVYLYGKNWMEVPPPEKRTNHAPLVLDFGDGVNVLEQLDAPAAAVVADASAAAEVPDAADVPSAADGSAPNAPDAS